MSRPLSVSKPLRIFCAVASGNVLGTYKHWRAGQDDPTQIAMTYSGQFYDLCHRLGAKGYLVACYPEQAMHQDEQFTVEHRPVQIRYTSLLYYWDSIRYGVGLILTAVLWRADVAVFSSGVTPWFVLILLRLFGIPVVASLHCVLWPKYQSLSKARRLVSLLDAQLFCRAQVMVASQDIADQIKFCVGKKPLSCVEFLPTYRRNVFSHIPTPPQEHTPFRVLYIGRLEPDKGVFDLLAIAQSLYAREGLQIIFDICGDGSALEELKSAVQASHLEACFILHGHCKQEKLRSIIGQSHIIVVPTRSSFVEGFNQVVVEGVLTGRPVITSSVCPSLPYVKDAILEVPPDDIEGYQRAIAKLYHDPVLYEKLRQNCVPFQEQFYDFSRSWCYALAHSLKQAKVIPSEKAMVDSPQDYSPSSYRTEDLPS